MQPRNRIRELRKAAGLSQDDVAQLLGVNRSNVSRLETGETTRLHLEKFEPLADRFGVTVPFLLGYDDNGNRVA